MVATLLSECCVTGYQLYVTRHDLNLLPLLSSFLKYLGAGFIMFLVVYSLNVNMRISILSLIFQISIGSLTYIGLLLILQPQIFTTAKALKQR